MKTLTSSILGIALLVGTAFAAQETKAPQPAAKPAAASTQTKTAKAPAKKVAHSTKKHHKATKSVAKKTAAPVTPVAAKK